MNQVQKVGSLAVLLAALVGCGGGGGGGSTAVSGPAPAPAPAPGLTPAPGPTPAPVVTKGVFTGYTGDLSYEGQGGDGGGVGVGGDGDGGVGAGGSLGQFKGAEAVVFLADGTELGRAIVDETTGLFTIKPGRDYVGPLLVEIRGRVGAQYFDEAKQAFIDFGPAEVLRAQVSRANRNIGITPLTDAAVAYLNANPNVGGVTLSERIASANKLVGTQVAAVLPAAYEITDIARLPTLIGPGSGAGAAADTAAGTYAIVLAALPEVAAMFNPSLSSPALSFTKSLALDLTDGKIDDRQIDGRPVAEPGAESYSSAELAGQLTSAISRSEVKFGGSETRNTDGQNLTLADGDFSAWKGSSLVVDDPGIEGAGPGDSTATTQRQATGGNPDAFFATSGDVVTGDDLSIIGIKDNYTYTPVAEGAIVSLSAAIDVTDFNNGSTSTLQLAVEQNQVVYLSVTQITFREDWARAIFNDLTAVQFESPFDGSNPDFTATAAPIKFGYSAGNTVGNVFDEEGEPPRNGDGSAQALHGADNFSLTINRATPPGEATF